MSAAEVGSLCLALLLIIAGANAIGQLFTRMRQPRVVGEILAGILLGPSLLGHFAPSVAKSLFGSDGSPSAVVLSFLYNLGLLLLMFTAGSEARRVLAKENRRATTWLVGLGTPLPFFLALALSPLLPIDSLMGTAGQRASVVLVLAIAVSVTSIPVISHIFYYLGILNTRFASLVLGAAVLEDMMLWVVLALATALAAVSGPEPVTGAITTHVAATVIYMGVGLTLAPMILRRLSRARWNVLAQGSPIAYIIAVLFAYVAIAAAMDVTLAFAAFLAGIGLVGGIKGTERPRFAEWLQPISRFSFATFIPIYLAIVGYRLDLTNTFSPVMVIAFVLGSSLLALCSIGLSARLSGFRGLDVFNLALVSNARGGPGIVLASVAYDAGIINAAFFTTLVLTAVITSQAAGWWLGFVLRKGWSLLSGADLRRNRTDEMEGVIDEDQDPVHTGPVVVATRGDQGT